MAPTLTQRESEQSNTGIHAMLRNCALNPVVCAPAGDAKLDGIYCEGQRWLTPASVRVASLRMRADRPPAGPLTFHQF